MEKNTENNLPDIFIKDEGDFCVVNMQTDKAKDIAYKHIAGLAGLKTSFSYPVEELQKLAGWAISHALRIDSEVPITIQPLR